MKLPFLYKSLNLPVPPEDLLPSLNPKSLDKILRAYQVQEVMKDGILQSSVENNLYHISPELKKWVQDNIWSEFNDVGLKYNFYNEKCTFLAPHTDVTRMYVLILNLATGDGDLVFWQEKNCPIERKPFTRHTPSDYSSLQEILRVNTTLHQWYIMNATVLHSVENLKAPRVQLQVSLNFNPFE